MKTTLLSITFLILFSGTLISQSIYMSTPRSAPTLSTALSVTEDFIGVGGAIFFTSKAATNFGVSFSSLSERESPEEGRSSITGTSLGFSFSTSIYNQLKGDAGNVDINLFYDRTGFENDEVINNSFGIGLSFSIRGEGDQGKGYIVPQGSIFFIPVSETTIQDSFNDSITTDQYVLGSFGFGFVFNTSDGKDFVLEPGLSYNITDEIFAFGVSASLIF